MVEGGVGTGKSWYAIEQARRLAGNTGADSGRDVLILHDRSQISNTPLAGLEHLLDHPLRP